MTKISHIFHIFLWLKSVFLCEKYFLVVVQNFVFNIFCANEGIFHLKKSIAITQALSNVHHRLVEEDAPPTFQVKWRSENHEFFNSFQKHFLRPYLCINGKFMIYFFYYFLIISVYFWWFYYFVHDGCVAFWTFGVFEFFIILFL